MTNTPTNQNLPASKLTALILGDAMVDTYLDSNPVSISDEAPVLILDWVSTTRTFGGMLNTATTLAALGFETHALGIVNESDESGRFVNDECTRLGISQHWISDGRPTIEKARVRTNPDNPPIEQLARIDVEWDAPLDVATATKLQTRFDALCKTADVIVVSDYCKGLLTESFAKHLIKAAVQANIPILVDAKPATLGWFTGATLLTPNESEARALATDLFGEAETEKLDRPTLTTQLANKLQAGILLTSAGAGMCLKVPQQSVAGEALHISAPAIEHVESTSGAGDVVIAVMALAAATNVPLANGAQWARHAVARTLARKGTCTLNANDLASLSFD